MVYNGRHGPLSFVLPGEEEEEMALIIPPGFDRFTNRITAAF